MQDGKHVILCVDDDQDIRDTLRTILESNGYMVVEAETGEAGLKAYKDQSPDLIIVDLMMEEVDAGTSFVKELRVQGNQAPVYMLSSVGDALHQSTDTSELGLAGVFQKPIKPDVLLQTIKGKLA